MCNDDKCCGNCEMFFAFPGGCPYADEKIKLQPACEKFRKAKSVTRADVLRTASLDEYAKLFALLANCEDCPAAGDKCDPEKGTGYGDCLAAWLRFFASDCRKGFDVVESILKK